MCHIELSYYEFIRILQQLVNAIETSKEGSRKDFQNKSVKKHLTSTVSKSTDDGATTTSFEKIIISSYIL